MNGFDVIIPFLMPIETLLLDQTISEIMVNPDGTVWIETAGRIRRCPDIHFDEDALATSLEVIANKFGKKLDADSPILNLRLLDGRPVEKHAQRGQALLDGWRGFGCLQTLDAGCNVDQSHAPKMAKAVGLAPRGEAGYHLGVGPAGDRTTDIDGRELEDAHRGLLVRRIEGRDLKARARKLMANIVAAWRSHYV